MLKKFNVSVAYALGIFVGNLRHFLPGLVHKIVFNEPLTHEFFRQLFLWLALFKLFFIAVSVEIAARIGCVNLINEVQLAIALAEFVFGVNKNQPLFCSYFLAACKELACPVFNNGIVFSRYNALRRLWW